MKLKGKSRKERISAGLSSIGLCIILIASCAEGFAKIDSVPANIF